MGEFTYEVSRTYVGEMTQVGRVLPLREWHILLVLVLLEIKKWDFST